ncbi:MAG: class II fructose-bisphosphate aldolase, partial [Candidatus Aminicenantes bacterium]
MIDKTMQTIDSVVESAVFGSDDRIRQESRHRIRALAAERGIYPASIQEFYEAAGRGLYNGLTVPAINIRGITYHVARAVFRAAVKDRVGALILEIARSEIGYTDQRPGEYAACILAAAVREGFVGPVFLQGDHFQVKAENYKTDSAKEVEAIKALVQEAVESGFYNIDIDASTLVDLEKLTLDEQQEFNCRVTAEMTEFIRRLEPEGTTISVGGEIGEVGKRNSTVEDLRAFMSGYLKQIG